MSTFSLAWIPYLLGIILAATLAGAVAVLFSRRSKAKLELEMEKVKEQLKMQSAMELERLKAELAAQQVKSDDRAVSRGPSEEIGKPAPPHPDWLLLPEVPELLAEACARGQCVLFAGTGLDAQFGMPDWSQTLARVIEQATSQGLLEGPDRLKQLLDRGDVEAVESLLLSRLNRQKMLDLCRQVMNASRSVSSSPANSALQQLPFASVITSSWNHWMDITFADRNPLTVMARSPELQQAVSGDRFLVVRLFGDPAKEESLVYGATEFRNQLEENETFRRLIASLVQTRMVLFVGVSLKGIEEFMKAIRLSPDSRYHYALAPFSEHAEFQKELFVGSYHTNLLLYPSDPGHTAVLQFMNSLRNILGDNWQWREASSLESGTISRIALQNIGPFSQVELKLNGGWNVLLGNNGCGKSTILKAIALGLCGDEPIASRTAEQLLKAGEDAGAIEIELAGTVYRTKLNREPSGSVRVMTSQITPLQKGRWIALGFPPLRGISQKNPSGPLGGTRSKPDVDDLLPLLTSTVDYRLDDVKQWIVNLDVKSTPGPEISEPDAKRNQQLRDSFFTRLDSLCPGVDFKFDRVARDSWEVYVKTQDGAASIPIEQVSQGTTSFLGWVGTVLQRSYQIHTDIEAAESSPAVVLVDEIDAHLHPAWQKSLVHLVSDRFKNLQIITTTHSPLVVAGMKASEVFIVRRDPSDRSCVSISQAPIEFEGLRADQILTSPLFGLASSRSDDTERDVDRYSRLLGIPDDTRTADEQREFESLRERLTSILAEGETEAERRVEKAVRSELRRAVNPEDPVHDEPLGAEDELRLRSKLSEVFRAEEPIQRSEAAQSEATQND